MTTRADKYGTGSSKFGKIPKKRVSENIFNEKSIQFYST